MVGFSFQVQFKSFPAMKNVMAQLFDETGIKEQGSRSKDSAHSFLYFAPQSLKPNLDA